VTSRDILDVAGGHEFEDEYAEGKRDRILHDITFRLKAGRVLGLLGRTGSGKTTLARLLFRLIDPQVGEVRIAGVDLRQAEIRTLRNRIGFVTQDVQLFEASLRENITCFALDVPDSRLLALMEMLGLGEWLARLPNGLDTPISTTSLSAGEAQLVALARVFLKDPGLIILDEASSRLDPTTEGLLERALDRLLAGRTAVIIAHRLATLDRATDILVLEEGCMVEVGPRMQLVNDPNSRFARLRYAGAGEVFA
jgi:ABC-type multidrug transport system fused ATPase/permease subunit